MPRKLRENATPRPIAIYFEDELKQILPSFGVNQAVRQLGCGTNWLFEPSFGEGRPEGRAEIHWDMARELIAIEDNFQDTLKPAPPMGADDRAGRAG
jgi:hypothetical protein